MEVIRQKSLLCAANNFKDACKLRCSYISCVWTGTLQTHTSTHLNLETVNRFVLFWQSIMRLCVFRFTERICCFRFTGVFFSPPYLQPEKTSEYRTTAFLSRCVITYGVFWLNSFSACAHFLNTISVEVLQSMWNVHVRRFEIKQFQYNLLLPPKRHNRCRVQEAEQEKAPDDSAFPFGKILKKKPSQWGRVRLWTWDQWSIFKRH